MNDDNSPSRAKFHKGAGGETHQVAGGKTAELTTAQGIPVADNQNTLRAGPRGPALLEDFHFREKIFHFDHERIPERVVHARGFGAHGFFETYKPLTDLTHADLFSRAGEKTPVFVRFSTVAGNKGSADLARDVRGFAVKFYTKEGNWDLVGNNIPVFFIQDAIKFPDLIHAAKQEPDRGFPQAQTAHDNFWDFISLMPESIHMALWIMSDRTLPRSFRFMEGFGVHTFKMVNAKGKTSFVKFHWKPKLGLQSVLWNEAIKINGADPDFHRRDLWDSIHNGEYPEWELGLQVFDESFCETFPFDVLDATKYIPEELVPVQRVGRLVLDRCVDNFFAETEQVAFCTQNIVPGIDFSNDPLLQGRNFSYLDTQIKRLGGPNFTHLPINAPKCPFRTMQQDGHMAFVQPQGRVNYEPNSYPAGEGGPREVPERGFKSIPEALAGEKRRYRSETFADHYSQARQFFASQSEIEQLHIAKAFTFELSKVENPSIRKRIVGHLLKVDMGLATKVATGLGMKSLPEAAHAAIEPQALPVSLALSMQTHKVKGFRGRKIGVFVTQDADSRILGHLSDNMAAEGVTIEMIATSLGPIKLDNGKQITPEKNIFGAPSVLYDAVVLMIGKEDSQDVSLIPELRDFVADAYAHCKYIAFTPAAETLLSMVIGSNRDTGFLQIKDLSDCESFTNQLSNLRYWERELTFDAGKA